MSGHVALLRHETKPDGDVEVSLDGRACAGWGIKDCGCCWIGWYVGDHGRRHGIEAETEAGVEALAMMMIKHFAGDVRIHAAEEGGKA